MKNIGFRIKLTIYFILLMIVVLSLSIYLVYTIALSAQKEELRRKLVSVAVTAHSLAKAIEAKDVYTKGHSVRVTNYAAQIAKKLNLPKDKIDLIQQVGILHDIGKIGVREGVLNKPEKLTDEAIEELRKNKGRQFDPEIVDAFIQILKG